MWSGQGPDPDEWWRDYHFWRIGVVPLLFAGMGAVAVVSQSLTIPGTSVALDGWQASLAGGGLFLAGGLAFGLLVALFKRLDG